MDLTLPISLARPVAFLDLETTGLNRSEDRIVELALLILYPDGRVVDRVRRFNPGIPIPAEASAVHGIGDADVAGEEPFHRRARSLAGLLAFNDVLPPDYRFLGTSRWNDPSVRAERHLRGGWFAAPAPDISARFAERYEQVFKAKPDRFSSMAYDAIALAAALAKQAQPKRNPFTRRALTDPNGFLGTDGIFRFRENGLIERGLAVLEVRRSRFETIDPPPDRFAIGTN